MLNFQTNNGLFRLSFHIQKIAYFLSQQRYTPRITTMFPSILPLTENIEKLFSLQSHFYCTAFSFNHTFTAQLFFFTIIFLPHSFFFLCNQQFYCTAFSFNHTFTAQLFFLQSYFYRTAFFFFLQSTILPHSFSFQSLFYRTTFFLQSHF